MRKLDHWIGKHLFVPIIIRICQAAKINQHRFHTYAWMLASMILFASAGLEGQWVWASINVLLCIMWISRSALVPDWPSADLFWLRAIMIVVLALIAVVYVGSAVSGQFVGEWDDTANIIMLAAEYASTIKTIPPKETKEKARALARQGG